VQVLIHCIISIESIVKMSVPNRLLSFLLGVIVGLITGVGFFYIAVNDLFNKAPIPIEDARAKPVQTTTVSEQNKINDAIRKNIEFKDTLNKPMNSSELLSKKYYKEVSVKKVMAESDSLLNDTTPSSSWNKNDFVIRKDRLLKSMDFVVTNASEARQTNPTDSLLEKISGIRNERNDAIAAFKVEFWQSPVNYKGYKMTKNKIVLFGMDPDETIMLFHNTDDDGIFLKQNQNYFKIYYTDNFRQFEKLADASIITRLK
jgi:hypothetical protein